MRFPLGLAVPTALALPLVLTLAVASGAGAQPRPPIPRTLEDATSGVPPAPATGFADVGPTHWAAPAIRRVVEKGVLEGWGGKFHGKDKVDRYQMAAILDRLLLVQADQTEQVVAELVVPPPVAVVAPPDPELTRELEQAREELAETRRALAEQQDTLLAVRTLFKPSRYKPW
jgi:hypothetical protein